MAKSKKVDLQTQHGAAPGFAEERAHFDVRTSSTPVIDNGSSTVVVGPAGRVLIPADLRTAMGIAEGDTLVATLEGQELRLMSTKAALKKAQAMVAEYVPAHVSLVDELLAERRRAFELEERRYGGLSDTAGVKTRKDRP